MQDLKGNEIDSSLAEKWLDENTFVYDGEIYTLMNHKVIKVS
jgi:hypothetical protein